MGQDNQSEIEIVGERNMETAEGAAKAIVWAMDSILKWYAPNPKQGNHVFRTKDEMSVVWASHDGDPNELPEVDFDTQMVVAMFLDAGEYEESPGLKTIMKVGDQIEVRYTMNRSPFSKVFNPCVAVAIPKQSGEVTFVNVTE